MNYGVNGRVLGFFFFFTDVKFGNRPAVHHLFRFFGRTFKADPFIFWFAVFVKLFGFLFGRQSLKFGLRRFWFFRRFSDFHTVAFGSITDIRRLIGILIIPLSPRPLFDIIAAV